ncbi:hypothetical protein HK100_001351, partial [Physocladia obscura]
MNKDSTEETYKAKYIKSLEERLECAEKLRAEEARAAALRAAAVTLRAQAKQLRRLCAKLGINSNTTSNSANGNSNLKSINPIDSDDDNDAALDALLALPPA